MAPEKPAPPHSISTDRGRYSRWQAPLVIPPLPTVFAPIGPTTISAPGTGVSLSKADGFMVRWNATEIGGAHVMGMDTSGPEGTSIDTTLTADPGSLAITPAMLTPLAPGPLLVMVTRGNMARGIAGAHARYRLGIGSQFAVSATLPP